MLQRVLNLLPSYRRVCAIEQAVARLEDYLRHSHERSCCERSEMSGNIARRLDILDERACSERAAMAENIARRLDSLDEQACGERAAMAANIARRLDVLDERANKERSSILASIKTEAESLRQSLVAALEDERTNANIGLMQGLIQNRWATVDAISNVLYPSTHPVECLICGHVAPRSAYSTRVSYCRLGGGVLERYVCPDCGAIFGPLKMMALNADQMADEYRLNYLVNRESDCTDLELRAFEALEPRKDGVYLNYGAGAWNSTTEKLRSAGYDVYDYEPYAPAGAHPWVVRSFDDLGERRFDGVFSNDLIEHLQRPVEDLKRMGTLLKPDAVMVHGSGCYEYAFEYTRFHLYFLTGNSLQRLASLAGFTVELGERLFPYSPARLCKFTRRTVA